MRVPESTTGASGPKAPAPAQGRVKADGGRTLRAFHTLLERPLMHPARLSATGHVPLRPVDEDPPASWARLRKGLARGGAEYFVEAGLSYLPSRWVEYAHHVLVRCERWTRAYSDRARDRVRIATIEDVDRLSAHGELTRDQVERRFRNGDTCAMVVENGRVLASTWTATGTRFLIALGRTFDIPPGAFYIHDTFTEPEARQRGLATLCYQRVFDLHAERGRGTAYAAVAVLNHPSRLAHTRWGFVPVGRTQKISVLGTRSTFCSRWPARAPRFQVVARRTPGGHPDA